MAERATHAAEPPATVAAAMKAADVVMAPTIQSLSHTNSRRAATEAGARIATLPGVTEAMLARVMNADMRSCAAGACRSPRLLRSAEDARITCPHGTDFRLGLSDRVPIADAGVLNAGGAFGNRPSARASSPRSRAAARGRWSSTARSPASASRPSPSG